MRKLNYKLIVSDFDGTLIDEQQQISNRVRQAIAEYVENGGIFAVCTGRMMRSILPQVRDLGLKGIVAAYQGTAIADIETGEYIHLNALTNEQTIMIAQTILSEGYSVNLYANEILYSNRKEDDELLNFYESVTGVKAVHLDDPIDFIKRENLCCQKITSLIMPDEKLALYQRLEQKLGKLFDITYSAAILVEISPLGDDKGGALKTMAEYYNIPLEKTIAVGDNLNDVSMLQIAGLGVAVANAVQPLKEIASCVVSSNNEDGIAEVIEKFGFIKE